MPLSHSIDSYISNFPEATQKKLVEIRSLVQNLVPDAEEVINYGIPTFKLNGNLVHFAGYKNHIGFYPAPSAITAFKDELANYETAKGSIKIPLDQDLPKDLITRIIQFRVQENLKK